MMVEPKAKFAKRSISSDDTVAGRDSLDKIARGGNGTEAGLVSVDHALNLAGVGGLGQRQSDQQARFPRLKVIAGDEAVYFALRGCAEASGGNAAAQAHEHAFFLKHLSRSRERSGGRDREER